MNHEIKKLFVSVISIVIGWLKKKMKLKTDIANMFQIEQLIKDPTHIDLAFSNRPETKVKSVVGMSDYSLIYIHGNPSRTNSLKK